MTRSDSNARVVVSKDGPYLVTGDIPLSTQIITTDTDGGSENWREAGTVPARKSYALCRCGQSRQKPFCDGSHAKVGFDGSETASRQSYLDQAKVFDGPAMQL